MKVFPATRPYFSSDPRKEARWIILLWLLTFSSIAILALAWVLTRSTELIMTLNSVLNRPLELFFRVFTFLGDDQFFMIFFSVLIWCVNKSLGFWGAFILLTSATYSNLIKDITMLPRPPLEGVTHPPGSYAFPSGHTLTAVTVWPYLAVRLKSRAFWIWSIVAVLMIGLSRLMLGYHYLGDVIGGFAFGIPFLLVFLWAGNLIYKNGWVKSYSTPLLLFLSLGLPLLLVALLPGADPPKVLGFLSGASFGYLLEKEKVNSSLKTILHFQVLKVLVGLIVLFAIIFGLSSLLPSAKPFLGFIRYGLGGLWVTLIAPILFIYLGLAKRN